MNIDESIELAQRYYQEGNLQKAESLCKDILKHQEDNIYALNLLGEIYYQRKQPDYSINCIKKALEYNPYSAEIHNNLGLLLMERGQFEDATRHFRKAIDINPQLPDLHYNLGNAFREKGHLDEAITYYQKALQLNPGHPDSYKNLGIIYREKGELDKAIHCYQKALEFDPTNSDIYVNLGIILQNEGTLTKAISLYNKALQYNPSNAFAYINMGNTLVYQGKQEEAEKCYRSALRIDSTLSIAYSNLLCSMNYKTNYDAHTIYKEHLRFNTIFVEPLSHSLTPHNNERVPHRKLKIGYLSPDFKKHSVSYFIEPILLSHNRENFEIYCYANILVPDEVTFRIQTYADYWRSIAGESDGKVAEIIRDDKIDILVDLAGHTANNRILVLALKPAPIQISWIGYPATTGLSVIDYKITDNYTDPIGISEQYYTEELLRLPGCFLCYLPDKESPEIGGLPASTSGYITFGSFNNYAKVSPEIIKLWTEILKSIFGSRLILKSHSFTDQETCRYTIDMFTQEGIDYERIELLPYEQSIQAHLNLYNRIDIALDTYPYHGTTTTCEALWMGAPVVTLAGNCHASRVGVSLLSNIGLPDLIARTHEEYITIAINLANNFKRLETLNKDLRDIMINSPLTDSKNFIVNLEKSYRKIWGKWCKYT